MLKKTIISLSVAGVAAVGATTAAVIVNTQQTTEQQNYQVTYLPGGAWVVEDDPVPEEEPTIEDTYVAEGNTSGLNDPQEPQNQNVVDLPSEPEKALTEPKICEYEQKYGGMTDFEALLAYFDSIAVGNTVTQKIRELGYRSLDQLGGKAELDTNEQYIARNNKSAFSWYTLLSAFVGDFEALKAECR